MGPAPTTPRPPRRLTPAVPLGPEGIHLVIAYDPSLTVQHAYGLDCQEGFAFIGSDGKVHATIDKAPTDHLGRTGVRIMTAFASTNSDYCQGARI